MLTPVNTLAVLAPGSLLSPSLFIHLSTPQDLLKVIYMDENTTALVETEGSLSVSTEKTDGQTAETRTGIRTICVSPDGKHLASGDRNGMLRYGTGRECNGDGIGMSVQGVCLMCV